MCGWYLYLGGRRVQLGAQRAYPLRGVPVHLKPAALGLPTRARMLSPLGRKAGIGVHKTGQVVHYLKGKEDMAGSLYQSQLLKE